MTKLGTPIGAGPKGAIVVVGLARVGAPPEPNWAPPPGGGGGGHPPRGGAPAAGVAETLVVGDAVAFPAGCAAVDRAPLLETVGAARLSLFPRSPFWTRQRSR